MGDLGKSNGRLFFMEGVMGCDYEIYIKFFRLWLARNLDNRELFIGWSNNGGGYNELFVFERKIKKET